MIPDHPESEDFRKNSFCPHFHKALFGAQYFYLLYDTATDFSHEASPPVRRHPSLLNDVSHMDGKSPPDCSDKTLHAKAMYCFSHISLHRNGTVHLRSMYDYRRIL